MTAEEIAVAKYMIFGERTCSWGVTMGSIYWFKNCHDSGGPNSRIMTKISNNYVAEHFPTIRARATEPGELFEVADWKVLRLR